MRRSLNECFFSSVNDFFGVFRLPQSSLTKPPVVVLTGFLDDEVFLLTSVGSLLSYDCG